MQKQNLCQGDFMPKNRQHYRKIKYPDKVTKQNALYLSGYFCLVLWEVEMLISRQPLLLFLIFNPSFIFLSFGLKVKGQPHSEVYMLT